MTTEQLQTICDRAGELAEQTLIELRLQHPDNIDGTKSGNQWAGLTKSRLVADILFDQFADNVDK